MKLIISTTETFSTQRENARTIFGKEFLQKKILHPLPLQKFAIPHPAHTHIHSEKKMLSAQDTLFLTTT